MKPRRARLHGAPATVAVMKCNWKTPYASERKAAAVAASGGVNGCALFAYRCSVCKKWHLTRLDTAFQGARKTKLVLREVAR